MNVWTNTSVRRSNGGEVQLGFGFPHSCDAVAAVVDCGRQLLVMVSKFASPLRAVDSYEPEAARTETSLTIPMVRLAAVYRSHRSGTKAADHRNPSSFRRQMLCR